MEWTPPASSRVVLLSLHLQVAYQEEESTVKSTVIAVDLAKNIFEIAVSAQPGKIRERKRVSRKTFLSFFGKRQPATVLLEACGTAHHWARRVKALGHRPVILPPHLVAKYRSGNKTDRNDVKALLESTPTPDQKLLVEVGGSQGRRAQLSSRGLVMAEAVQVPARRGGVSELPPTGMVPAALCGEETGGARRGRRGAICRRRGRDLSSSDPPPALLMI
jgi:transposase